MSSCLPWQTMIKNPDFALRAASWLASLHTSQKQARCLLDLCGSSSQLSSLSLSSHCGRSGTGTFHGSSTGLYTRKAQTSQPAVTQANRTSTQPHTHTQRHIRHTRAAPAVASRAASALLLPPLATPGTARVANNRYKHFPEDRDGRRSPRYLPAPPHTPNAARCRVPAPLAAEARLT